jgi:hypothetical protein
MTWHGIPGANGRRRATENPCSLGRYWTIIAVLDKLANLAIIVSTREICHVDADI